MKYTKTLRGVWITLAVSIGLGLPVPVGAQGTPADYERAAGLKARYESAAIDLAGPPNWIGNTNRFWYRRFSRGANEFIIVDAQTQEKRPAFDHEKIAASLSKSTGNTYSGTGVPPVKSRASCASHSESELLLNERVN